MKIHVKKKARQAWERAQAFDGYVNDASGKYVKANGGSGTFKNMDRDYIAGYRVGRRKKSA